MKAIANVLKTGSVARQSNATAACAPSNAAATVTAPEGQLVATVCAFTSAMTTANAVAGKNASTTACANTSRIEPACAPAQETYVADVRTILLLFAHPSLEKSRIQRAWLDATSDLEGVELRDLYQLYPEFDIDVDAEQAAMERSDVIVMQHPMYWYSTPAILKQWQDLVLEHGWAYGGDGTALEGKKMLSAISMGGPKDAYQPEGFHGVTVSDLLAPIRQTARLCKMDYLPPFLEHSAFQMTAEEVVDSALAYRAVLEGLRDESLDLDAAHGQSELRPSSPSRSTERH